MYNEEVLRVCMSNEEEIMTILISILPIVLPVVLLGILNMPAVKGMSITALVIAIAGFFYWGMPGNAIVASVLQGIHKSLPIAWILLGAMLLLRVLQHTGAISRINLGFMTLTQDMRLQAVIIAFFFGSLIEGVSGFGTPAMVTGPLLIALGFKPISAVFLALVSDSTAVSFGAVGTPLTVGLSNSVPANELGNVATQISQIELFVGTFLPLILIGMLILVLPNQYKNNRVKSLLEITPWLILIGLTYTATSYFVVNFIGYEMASIISPLVAIGVSVVTIKFGILLPKSVKENPWRQTAESLATEEKTETELEAKSEMPLLLAWMPYILVVLALLTTKFVMPIKTFINSTFDLSYRNILGFESIKSDWLILANPGTILIIVALITLYMQGGRWRSFQTKAVDVVKGMRGTMAALVVTLIMVQIFTNSSINTHDLVSMPLFLATTLAKYLSNVWIMIAPVLGALGSFITGSATVSTLTFAPIQDNVAMGANLNQNLILALQVIGAAVGNMICIHNIVAAGGAVGLNGKEGDILRKTIVPAIIYLALLIVVGSVFGMIAA